MTSPISANSLMREWHDERELKKDERQTLFMRLIDWHEERRARARKRRSLLAAEQARLGVELRPHARVGRVSA